MHDYFKEENFFRKFVILNVYSHQHENYLQYLPPFKVAQEYQQYMTSARATFPFYAPLPSPDRLKLITKYGHFFVLFEYFRSNKTQFDNSNLQEFIKIVQAASNKMSLLWVTNSIFGNEYLSLREPLIQFCKDNPSSMQTKAQLFIDFISTNDALKSDFFSTTFFESFQAKGQFEYHRKSNVTPAGSFFL